MKHGVSKRWTIIRFCAPKIPTSLRSSNLGRYPAYNVNKTRFEGSKRVDSRLSRLDHSLVHHSHHFLEIAHGLTPLSLQELPYTQEAFHPPKFLHTTRL